MEHYPKICSKECEINLRPGSQTRKLHKAKVTSEYFQRPKRSRLSNNFLIFVFLKKNMVRNS